MASTVVAASPRTRFACDQPERRRSLRITPRNENHDQGPEVDAGVYGERLTVGGEVQSTTVRVIEDEWLGGR